MSAIYGQINRNWCNHSFEHQPFSRHRPSRPWGIHRYIAVPALAARRRGCPVLALVSSVFVRTRLNSELEQVLTVGDLVVKPPFITDPVQINTFGDRVARV